MGIIATENDARTIGGSSGSYTSNLCATKSRAIALDCTVSGNYDNNLLVLLSDLSSHRNYFKLTTTSSGTFTFTGNNLDYSTNGGTSWTTLQSGSATPSFSSGTEVLWRFTKSDDGNRIGTFSSTCSFTASGNIMSLLYGDNFENLTAVMTKCFDDLFGGSSITSASSLLLPATTLATKCYQYMFYGCSSLTSGPSLPATTLANYCYCYMFNGCSSLTSVPSLPATILATSCYENMFVLCSSLRTIPSNLLQATSLVDHCYYGMFRNCTALTNVISLPATTLATWCYTAMFEGCTSITTLPSNMLPATSLLNFCYNAMFRSCTSLNTIPSNLLPATSLALGCYLEMFGGCTSLTIAPSLNATTLANGCYSLMFFNCSSLITAPTLPAPTLILNCYWGMFIGCSSLSSITCYATSISASNCTTDWVRDVAASGTFYKNSSTLWRAGTSGIPNGWTVVNSSNTITIENYGIFLDYIEYNSSITSVTFQYTVKIVATPDSDGVACDETYLPIIIALYNAGTAYPLTWSSSEGYYALKPYALTSFAAPWVNDGYGTDIHVVIEANDNQTGTFCYTNTGLTLTFEDTTLPYVATCFKMNGVYPVVLSEENPCCMEADEDNYISGDLQTYIPN